MPGLKRIAFVTSAEYAGLTDDDRLALSPLRARGIAAEPAIWNDPAVRWEEYDRIVIRSTWDYHLFPDAFRKWIGAVASLPLANPAEIVRWNMEKTYLRDLEAGGIAVPPTLWVGRGERASLKELARGQGWTRAVVKPTVSGSAYETWIVTPDVSDDDEARFQRLLSASGVMVQKFMEPIDVEGEWSLLFFDRQYSHAVLKRPKRGDFRVQSDFGGTVDAVTPPAGLLDQAAAVLRLVPGPLLYARVDGVVENGRLILMELEILEPAIFLHADPAAPGRFCDAIERSTPARASERGPHRAASDTHL